MTKTTVAKLKKGEFFRLSESEKAPVWIRGEYVRSEKKYSCTKFDDINHENWFKGSKEGNMKITNSGGTDFGMMQYGGTSSSYPAIKRSGTKIQIRLADDSNFGTVEVVLRIYQVALHLRV